MLVRNDLPKLCHTFLQWPHQGLKEHLRVYLVSAIVFDNELIGLRTADWAEKELLAVLAREEHTLGEIDVLLAKYET